MLSPRDQLIAIESEAGLTRQVLDTHDGPLIWPFLRYALVIELEIAAKGINPRLAIPQTQPAKHLAQYFVRAFGRRIPNRVPASEAIFFASSIRAQFHNGEWFNPSTDPFADACFPRPCLIVEDSVLREFRIPRQRSDRVLSHDWTTLRAGMMARLRLATRRTHRDIDYCINSLRATCKALAVNLDEPAFTRIRHHAIMYKLKHMTLLPAYLKLLSRARPKVIFVEAAHYGGRNASIVAAAQQLGIVTAEIQHGFLSREHPCYNMAPGYIEAGKRTLLPDYLLTYGPFWQKDLQTPAQLVTVGHPTLLETAHLLRSSSGRSKIRILIISQPAYIETLLNFARSLASQSSGRASVCVRPHPNDDRTLFRDLAGSGATVDEGALYQSLAAATCVIGVNSTTLFEALAFGCKVAVFDVKGLTTASMPRSIFPHLSAPDEFLSFAEGADGNARDDIMDEIWNPHWRKAFQQFVRETCSRDGGRNHAN
jgi:hypothetical protein